MAATIACVACLDESLSVHTATFMRAISCYREWRTFAGGDVPTLLLYDDSASAVGARTAATAIVRNEDVGAVVGHFSSTAADAAGNIYEAAGIPLFLPAATSSHLTQNKTTFRICDNDDDYVSFLLQICRDKNYRLTEVANDGSLHGKSLTRKISSSLAEHESHFHSQDGTKDVILFAGSCSNSAAFLRRLDPADVRPVVLTDDAMSSEIISAAAERRNDILIVCLAPTYIGSAANWIATRYQAQYVTRPGCYFWETVAALEIATASAGKDVMAQAWETVVGRIFFDPSREARPQAFATYRADANGLHRL